MAIELLLLMDESKDKTALDKTSDSELLERYRKGEESAFREIVSRYKNSLYAFLRRFISQQDVVEDVFQETFLQLYSSRDSFDVDRPLRPWLFTIAANKAKDALRKIQRQATMSMGTMADAGDVSMDEVVNILTSYETTPEDEVSRDETSVRVRQIISEMPDNLREILLLAYFEQFSYKHMAEILSIPIGTVKSRLHTAVAHFMKKWKAADRGDNNA
ncbi:MAG TPA: sigma-70 family RNA polymerase sigma factor [Anaerohalosphaeraceae bacterium]|nr:sigma-70 family RNA polymerase sigma factor [Anaerohalosphaeraceae bacterium]